MGCSDTAITRTWCAGAAMPIVRARAAWREMLLHETAVPGPGSIMFDVLAAEGLGERTDITTVPPRAKTIQVPGSRQALDRSQLVAVRVRESEGVVRRPSLLGALVAKAAATSIAVRSNPERDWEDAALLLSLVRDPIATRA